jgi:hypothetical protein
MLEEILKQVRHELNLEKIKGVIDSLTSDQRDQILGEFILLNPSSENETREEFYIKLRQKYHNGNDSQGPPKGERFFLGMLAGMHSHSLSFIDYFGAGCENMSFMIDKLGSHGLSKAKKCFLSCENMGFNALEFTDKCISIGNHGDYVYTRATNSRSSGNFGNYAMTQSESCNTQGTYGTECFPWAERLIVLAKRITSFYPPKDSIVIFNECGKILPPIGDIGDSIIMTTGRKVAKERGLIYVPKEEFGNLDIFNKDKLYSRLKEVAGKYNKRIPQWLENIKTE